MTEAYKFEATKREKLGTGSARAARRADLIPAVIYGADKDPVHVTLPRKEFTLAASKAGFKSHVLHIVVDGKEVKTLAREIQLHPVTDRISHVDMQNINENEQIRVAIPVKFINRDKSPGIKRGGILNIVRRNIEFLCTHTNIPKEIIFDLDGKEIGDSVHIEDTKLPADITPIIKRNFTVMTLLGKGAKALAAEEAEDSEEAEGEEGAAKTPKAPEATKQKAEAAKEE